MSKNLLYYFFNLFIKKEFNKKLFVFSIFFLLASLLWFLNALEKRYTVTIPITIEYQNIPKTKALLVNIPQEIKVEVDASGYSLLQLYLNPSKKNVQINVGKLCKATMQNQQILKIPTLSNKNILHPFNNNIIIKKINPDTIVFQFAEVSKKKVAVKPTVDLQFTQQYQLQNNVYVSPDSIVIYGAQQILNTIDSICTFPISKKSVSESFSQKINFKKNRNVQYSDTMGVVYVDVEKFTEQQFLVPIEPIHVPDSLVIDLMQQKVLITMFIGLSKSKSVNISMFKVVADYSKQDKITGDIPVQIIKKPNFGKIVKQSPEKVGCIIDLK